MAAMSRSRSRATVGWRAAIRRRLCHGRSERGAVLVEAAFVFPVFMLMLFGMIEFGFIFKDGLTLTTMVQAGARTGAEVGNSGSPSADWEILSAIKGASTSLNAPIDTIVVFNADPTSTGGQPLDTVPSGCLPPSTGVLHECNVYSADQLKNLPTTWDGTAQSEFCGIQGCADGDWTPSSRLNVETGNGPDYLGVYIQATHKNITGFFGTVTLHETDIMRIEPQGFS